MIIAGCKKDKCVYAYEFSDRSVYVGITNNIQRRTSDRKRRPYDTVTRYTNESGLIPIHKQLTELLPVEEAVFLEAKFVEEYKNNNWYILNKAKTGGVGVSILYWTKEKCLEKALKYTTKNDFWCNNKGAYDSARRNKWLPEICSHMKPYRKWTKERCEIKALLCDTRSEFKKKYGGAYQTAKINKWLDEICQYMIILCKPKGYWTLETCIEDFKKYTSKGEWRKNSPSVYTFACKHNYLRECYQ